MNKKLLICGSAIAVVVLVLASLSPVIGYNSVESSAKESPLFNVRTKRAINEDSETLTCNYLRKGLLMPFPTRNSRTVLIQKFISKIETMDKEEYDRLIDFATRYFERNSPDELKTYLIKDNNDFPLTVGGEWSLVCMFILLFITIGSAIWVMVLLPFVLIAEFLFEAFMDKFYPTWWTCNE